MSASYGCYGSCKLWLLWLLAMYTAAACDWVVPRAEQHLAEQAQLQLCLLLHLNCCSPGSCTRVYHTYQAAAASCGKLRYVPPWTWGAGTL